MVPPLRVAIDLRPLALESGGGIALLVGQILDELGARGVSFVGVSDRPVPAGRVPSGVPVWAVDGPGGRIRWEALALPGILSGLDPPPDLYHATWNHGVPRGLPFPSLLSLHDVIPWQSPRLVPWPRPAFLHRALYRRAVRSSVSVAARIVTLSEASRRAIEALLPRAAERIDVVPCALPRWFAEPASEAVAAMRTRFGGPYWLYVGGFDRRKGVEILIESLALLAARGVSLPPIVLAGALNEEGRALRARARAAGLAAHFPGYVPDAELAALYGGASLFLYPSRAEGFGIPPLLAMAAGVPVVAADDAAVREVVGDAALLAPPADAPALADVIERARAGHPLAELRALGRARAARFTAGALAERMLRVYERAAGHPGGSR